MRPIVLALATTLALSACTSHGAKPTARPSGSTPPSTPAPGPSCPARTPTSPKWPRDFPGVIPKPVGARVDAVKRPSPGTVQVDLTVPYSMHDAVLFVVTEFKKAGLTLERGSAESTEATAPFRYGSDLRGLVRVFTTQDECVTRWLVAVVRRTGAGTTSPTSG